MVTTHVESTAVRWRWRHTIFILVMLMPLLIAIIFGWYIRGLFFHKEHEKQPMVVGIYSHTHESAGGFMPISIEDHADYRPPEMVIVKKGDTLWSIRNRHCPNLRWDAFRDWMVKHNHLKDENKLPAGGRLTIPGRCP